METGFLIDICRDIFMAIHAQQTLTFFIEHFVAGGTFALEVGVVGNDFARHDQRLNILS